jgi:hypothetical protein
LLTGGRPPLEIPGRRDQRQQQESGSDPIPVQAAADASPIRDKDPLLPVRASSETGFQPLPGRFLIVQTLLRQRIRLV